MIDYHAIDFETAGGGVRERVLGLDRSCSSLFWLGALYWIETLVAQSLAPPAGVTAPGHRRQ